MIVRPFLGAIGAAMLAGTATSIPAQVAPREPTDIMVRRLAGLPAATAEGQIEIIDVGHSPLSTMLTPAADHAARTYTLPSDASAEVDGILATLRQGAEPDGQQP